MKIACEACGARYAIPDEKVKGAGRVFKITCRKCGQPMLLKGLGDAEGSDWYYAVGTERHGPVDREQLEALVERGDIGPETYVWHQGMSAWSHLKTVPALQPLLPGGEAQPESVDMEALQGEEPTDVGADTTMVSQEEIAATHHALDDVMDRTADEEPHEAAEAEAPGEGAPGSEAAEDAPAAEQEPAEEAPAAEDEPTTALAAFGAEGEAGGDLAADTTMIPQAEIEAAHARLGGAAEPAEGEATVEAGAEEEEPFAEREGGVLAEDEIGAPGHLAAATGDAGESSAGAPGAEAAEEDTLFGGAAAPEAAETDDIFGGAYEGAPEEAAEPTAGGRRETSVLFSLDELGDKQEPAPDPLGEDSLLTESSGLLDIRAVAARSGSSQASSADSPFGEDLGADLVAPTGGSGAGVHVAAPIVRRKTSNTPKIVAGLAVLLLVGVVGAWWWTSKEETPAEGTAPTAEEVAPAPEETATAEAAEQPETPPPGEEAAAAAAAAGEEEQPPEGEEAAEGEETAEGEEAAAEGEEAAAAAAAKAEEEKAEEKAAEEKPEPKRAVRRKPTPKPRPEPKPEPREKAKVAPAPAPSPSGGSKDVNDLLRQLNKKKEAESGGGEAADPNLPAKLNAATLKSTLRKRHRTFSACYDKMANRPPGAVTVKTSLVIGGDGGVKSARVTSGGGTSPDVQTCIVSALRSTSFPKFRDNQMIVNYPIVLR